MSLCQVFDRLQKKVQGTLKTNEPMKNHTSWKIGGPADIMVLPRDTADICAVIKTCRELQVPWQVFGCGSNILVLDGGIRGVVLITNGILTNCHWKEDGAEAESGVMLPRLAKEAAKRGFAGLEWCMGIPASVGGAVVMNAGVGISSFGDFVAEVEVVDEEGNICRRDKKDLSFEYRYSSFLDKREVITRVKLILPFGDREECRRKIKEHMQKRRSAQPLEYPTAGSVFKNPPGDYAGRLVEAAGAKGLKIGAAQISAKHANFIINLGGARAEDVIQLIEEVKKRVQDQFNIQLETEVHIVGEAR